MALFPLPLVLLFHTHKTYTRLDGRVDAFLSCFFESQVLSVLSTTARRTKGVFTRRKQGRAPHGVVSNEYLCEYLSGFFSKNGRLYRSFLTLKSRITTLQPFLFFSFLSLLLLGYGLSIIGHGCGGGVCICIECRLFLPLDQGAKIEKGLGA